MPMAGGTILLIMQAVAMKVSYPAPKIYQKLFTVEFPDRHLSYVIVSAVSCTNLEHCIAEVKKAVGLQNPVLNRSS